MKIPPVLAALCCILLSVSPLSAQIKKGFKYLDRGKFDAAIAAFAQDTTNPDLRPAALFGMAQALSDERNPAKDYRSAMRLQERALAGWKVLKSAQKTPLTKKYKVSYGAIEQLRRKAATTAWKLAEKTTSLREIDEYLEVFPKNAAYIDRKALKKQSDLIAETATKANTYAEIQYVYNQHFFYLENKLPDVLEPLEHRLFSVFLKENGARRLDAFIQGNPRHPLAEEPDQAAFSSAWESNELLPMLDFLTTYPTSGFAPYLRDKCVDILKTKPLDEQTRNSLTAQQQGVLAEIEWLASGNAVDLSKPYSDNQKAGWMLYIRRTAPSSGAFTAAEKMYRYYVGKRDWAGAAEILQAGAELFPEEKKWFDDRLTIVQRPGVGIVPVSAGPVVNSSGDEYSPILSADGKRLYFGGKNRPDNQSGEDVFMSERTDTGWTMPVLVSELSGNGHQVPISLTADGNSILIFNKGKPFQSNRTATGWTEMQPLPGVSQFSWVGLVQIAANNQVMLLEARDYTTSATDIFVAQRNSAGEWGAPVRLDSTINTDGDDRTPFLHPDMRTLYFSSSGHPGLGEMDVFVSRRLDDTWLRWSAPVNLGKEINTPGNDWSYTVSTDGTTAWFGSLTDDNGEDIFFVSLPSGATRPDTVKLVEVEVKDENGNPLTEGKVILKDPVTGEVTGSFRINPDGGATVLTIPDDRQYLMTLEKEGYYPQSMNMPRLAPGELPRVEVKWSAPRLAAGVTQVLNIFFDYNQDALRPESNAELQQIAQLARNNQYIIKLTGYTDNVGNTDFNLDLSRRRAEAARKALIALGVASDQVVAEGKGESDPVAVNDTEEHRAKNRRVVIQLLQR